MIIRKINQEELDDFFKVGLYAFGSWQDEPEHDPTGWFNPDECLGLFDNGRLFARLRNRSFQQVIRGSLKPMGGIASVASYPEHRRQGYVRQLMQAAFVDMREKGQVVSALYPFREGFYGRFGYVTTNSTLEVKIPTHALEHHLAAAADLDGGWSMKRQPAWESGARFLHFMAEQSLQWHGSVLYPPDIPDDLLARFWQDQLVVFIEQQGQIQAAARYQVKGALTDGVLTIHEMAWDSFAARDKLLGFFARHADATPACWLSVPLGTNFQSWLYQPTIHFESKISYLNMMGRVVDVAGACAGLPAFTEGECCFTYEDAQCPWNDGRFRLSTQNGTLHAQKTRKACQLHLTPQGLSALVYGSLSFAEVVYRGWVTAVAEPAQHLFSHWFPPRLAFNINHF